MNKYKLQKEDNKFFTEPILSEEEWLAVLHNSDNDRHRHQLNAVLMFFYQPDHRSTCTAIEKEYSISTRIVNMHVVNFGKYVKKVSGKEFFVEQYESSDEVFWPIVMLGKDLKNHFEWQLRPELVSALRHFLLEKLLSAYRGPILSEGLDNSRSEELYKWKLLSRTKGKSILDILNVMGTSSDNNILTWRTKESIRNVLKDKPNQLEDCFAVLLSPNCSFYDRFHQFVDRGKAFMSKADAERILKEKEACLFLACNNPEDNALYKWTLYKEACAYLGIDTKSSRPVDGYLAILNDIISLENQDPELIEKLKSETADYFWSELLNAQDVLYQMQDFMRNSRPKNWLQHIYDEAIKSEHWVFKDWYPEYKKSVERFLSMFADGTTAEDVDEDTKEYFIKTHENYISSNLQGMYSSEEYERIMTLWPKMYAIFKRDLDSGVISRDDYDEMDKLMQPALKRQHPAAFHRMWAGLFPNLLSTTISGSKFRNVYEKVRHYDTNLPKATGHWLEDNVSLMKYFKEKVTFKETLHQGLLAWYLYENLNINENSTDMDKYINLLKSNHNIVLTGAPGTGKTFLAKEIAKSMGCAEDEIDFVQFHPSYDYTDFVEGLRPIEDDNGDVNFERKDGVFKEFCAKALENLLNSQKSLQTLQQEISVRDLLEDFIQDAMESDTQFETQGTKNVFHILDNKAKTITIEIPKNEKARVIALPKSDLITLLENKVDIVGGKDIQIYFNRKYRTQQDSYTFVLYEKLKNKKSDAKSGTISLVSKKNFVFIIDEINRGELSKIFGELFFAIDPGYRGTKGCVKTQYQNLVESGDPFEKGFYVPENVYIIGTMNDIDRGVESMDFAIRRRFAWVEVNVEDRMSMLDEIIPDWSEAAKRCMTSLNAALKEKAIGLTSAYDIGPAYFLKLEQYDGDFEKLWNYHIKGIVTEYLRGTRGVEEKVNVLKEAFDAYKQ